MSNNVLAFCLLWYVALSLACYLQDCDPEVTHNKTEKHVRKCLPCGPQNKGRCFGPGICCGEDLGCYFGTPDTGKCHEENYLPTPCVTGKKQCGKDGGNCGAAGICCNAKGCVLDSTCEKV